PSQGIAQSDGGLDRGTGLPEAARVALGQADDAPQLALSDAAFDGEQVAFALILRRGDPRTSWRRRGAAGVTPLALSALFAVALAAVGPRAIGGFRIGARDTPFLWAPLAFIAVAAALPIVIWWARRYP